MAALVMLSAAVLLGLLLPSSMANNVLYGGDTLYAGRSITQGNYRFVMHQTDCNLVLFEDNQELWSSDNKDARDNTCYGRLNTNGNLVIDNHYNVPLWSSNTTGEEDKYILVLHRDGHVVIYKPIWIQPAETIPSNSKGVVIVKRGHGDTSITAADDNILYADDTLSTGQSLTEWNNNFIMNSTCSLVLNQLYDQAVLWTSPTNGLGDNCYALLQTDGNFVVKNERDEVVWTSNTAGKEDKPYIVVLHRDGYVVIYRPIWIRPETNTVKRGITAADEPTNRKITMVTYN